MDERPLYERSFTIVGGNFDNAGERSTNIKAILNKSVVRKAALVAYESEINIVSYAKKGMIRLPALSRTVL